MFDVRQGRFELFLRQNCHVSSNQHILVAVSGGVDSVVLCELLHKIKQPFAIAHVNFKLRGSESDQDQLFVKKLAKTYRVEFHTKSFKTEEYAKKHKQSIQIAARELRFTWFETIRQKYNYEAIAIASHKDDTVETFFINLMRGTGLEGLSGIKARYYNIIHPLLLLTKTEIMAYAKKRSLKYREDSSNKSLKYTRNKIRHQLIPLLEELQPDISDKITHLNHIVREYSELLEKTSHEYAQKYGTYEGDKFILRVRDKAGSFIPEIILHHLLKPYLLEYKQVFKLHQALDKIGKKFISLNHIIWVDRDRLIIEKKKALNNQNKSYQIELNQRYFKPFLIDVCNVGNKGLIDFKNPKTTYFNASKLSFPLLLRKWHSGDVFQPFGMKGKKKISDYLIDKKVSRSDKENTWVLLSDGTIIWVVGIGISETCRVLPNTKELVKITL